MTANQEFCVRTEVEGSKMPLLWQVAPLLDREDPLYIFNNADCRPIPHPYCNEVEILGGDESLMHIGYGLCAMYGENNENPPSILKDFGYAKKMWQAWKDTNGMGQEECAEAYLEMSEILL